MHAKYYVVSCAFMQFEKIKENSHAEKAVRSKNQECLKFGGNENIFIQKDIRRKL